MITIDIGAMTAPDVLLLLGVILLAAGFAKLFVSRGERGTRTVLLALWANVASVQATVRPDETVLLAHALALFAAFLTAQGYYFVAAIRRGWRSRSPGTKL